MKLLKIRYILPVLGCVGFLLFSCATGESLDELVEPMVAIESMEGTMADGEAMQVELFVGEQVSFNEIWSYVLVGRENTLSNELPLTDVGYFGAQINNYGSLSGVPNAENIAFFKGRVHLVVVNNHAGMTHMVLSPDYPFRSALIDDLVEAVSDNGYDGLQIDFELVLANDKENFLSFLEELAERLSKVTTGDNARPFFSIAVPARTRYLSEDAYDYKEITAIVDSVFVMAYDEHWSGGTAGPVSSFDWGKKVAEYSLEIVGKEKLVMGQPFYGRTWGDVQGNRAFFHSGIERQIDEFNVENLERVEGVLTFTYTVPLTITAFFDDARSIAERSQGYKDMGIGSTGFWCLGQEDPAVWQQLTLN